MRQQIRLFIIFLVLSIVINLLILNLFYKPKRTAVLDMQSIKNEYIKNIANKNITEEEMERFVIKINQSISKIASDNNLIIIPKQAVFSGEDIDITEQFKKVVLDVK